MREMNPVSYVTNQILKKLNFKFAYFQSYDYYVHNLKFMEIRDGRVW